MKVIAAYLLAVLGGNTSPSAEDLKDILGSGEISFMFFLLILLRRLQLFFLGKFIRVSSFNYYG